MSFANRLKQRIEDIKVLTIASEEVTEQRLETCAQCPKLFELTGTCTECGCFVAIKSKIAAAKCPLGKW